MKNKARQSAKSINRGAAPAAFDPLKANALRLVDDLLRLREIAHEPSARHKEAHAHEALKLASMLFDELAGWARNHVIGRVAAGHTPFRYAPGTVRDREFQGARPWDNPDLERSGASYEFDNPEVGKRIVRAFAEVLGDALGRNLAHQLYEAFDQLLFGRLHVLVRPSRTYLKGDARKLWQLRLRAIEHVHFQMGQGFKKFVARDRVADLYGLNENARASGRDTLTQWERRLRRLFDPFIIKDTFARAKAHGGWYVVLKKKEAPLGLSEHHFLADIESEFGDASLKADGRRHRRLNPKTRRRR